MYWTIIKTALGGWKAYALIAVVAVAVVAGAYIKGRMDGSAICDGRIATAAADFNAARDKAVAEAEARRAVLARHLVEIDSRHTKEMADAQANLDSLRADVAAGKRRLRVAAQCPAAPGVPATPGSSSVDHASSPELGPDAIEAYWTLRRQHREVTERLLACQGILSAERGK